MKSIFGLAVGASLAVAAFASAPVAAMPLSAGLAPSAADAHASSLTEQVQYRRGGPRGYGGPRVYGGGPRYYRRGGIGPGGAIAAGAAIGILGAAAAASAAPSYYPAPAYGYGGYPAYGGGCYWERRPVYDAWGNPRGTHPFQVCR